MVMAFLPCPVLGLRRLVTRRSGPHRLRPLRLLLGVLPLPLLLLLLLMLELLVLRLRGLVGLLQLLVWLLGWALSLGLCMLCVLLLVLPRLRRLLLLRVLPLLLLLVLSFPLLWLLRLVLALVLLLVLGQLLAGLWGLWRNKAALGLSRGPSGKPLVHRGRGGGLQQAHWRSLQHQLGGRPLGVLLVRHHRSTGCGTVRRGICTVLYCIALQCIALYWIVLWRTMMSIEREERA